MSKKLEELKVKYGVSERAAILMGRMDPTTNKKYVEWLFKVRYNHIGNSKYKLNPDFPATLENSVNQYLVWFEKNLNGKIPAEFRDINKFKTINEFIEKVTDLATPSRSEIKKSVRTVLDNERFRVITPLTYEASKMHGTGTKWCTTNKTYYDNYTNNGILYYILDKNLDRKFGVHVPNSSGNKPNINSLNLFNNEDRSLSVGSISLVYGDGFNIVIEAIKKDFSDQITIKLKKQALKSAIDKISGIKRELKTNGLNSDEVENLLNSLSGLIKTKENSF